MAAFTTDESLVNADFENQESTLIVLSTVIKILSEFVEKIKPRTLKFEGTKESSSNNIQRKRTSVYRRLIKKFIPDNYTFEEKETISDIVFIIKKKE